MEDNNSKLKEGSILLIENPAIEDIRFMRYLIYTIVGCIKHLDYETQANLINYEFNTNITKAQLIELEKPTTKDILLDNKVLQTNLGFYDEPSEL